MTAPGLPSLADAIETRRTAEGTEAPTPSPGWFRAAGSVGIVPGLGIGQRKGTTICPGLRDGAALAATGRLVGSVDDWLVVEFADVVVALDPVGDLLGDVVLNLAAHGWPEGATRDLAALARAAGDRLLDGGEMEERDAERPAHLAGLRARALDAMAAGVWSPWAHLVRYEEGTTGRGNAWVEPRRAAGDEEERVVRAIVGLAARRVRARATWYIRPGRDRNLAKGWSRGPSTCAFVPGREPASAAMARAGAWAARRRTLAWLAGPEGDAGTWSRATALWGGKG